MKTNIYKMSKWTQNIVTEARKESLDTMGVRTVTSDGLLLQVLLDRNSKLTSYMIEKGHFATQRAEQFLDSSIICKHFKSKIYLETCYDLFQVQMLENYELVRIYGREIYSRQYSEKEYSSQAEMVLATANQIAYINGTDEIGEEELIVALVKNENPIWYYLFASNSDYYENLKEKFSIENLLSRKF